MGWTEQAYAYAGGSPTNGVDPAGLWAVGICSVGQAGLVVGVAASDCLAVAGSGSKISVESITEVGEQQTILGQFGVISGFSVGVGIEFSPNANKLSDLEGPFLGFGGAVGKWIEPYSVGGDYVHGQNSDCEDIRLYSLQSSIGEALLPVDLHLEYGPTVTKWRVTKDDARIIFDALKKAIDRVKGNHHGGGGGGGGGD